ncbi:MAG: hypothetical protein H0V63_10290 [Burkholderiaceae bacterium]|nr:hypothetical protein [Burkholderiaceae bacterium]
MPALVGPIDYKQVKQADLCALQTERQDLLPESDDSYWPMLDGVEAYPDMIEPWSRDVARIGFLAKFALLSAKL